MRKNISEDDVRAAIVLAIIYAITYIFKLY